MLTESPAFVAFQGHQLIAAGPLPTVALAARQAADAVAAGPVLIFDGHSSRPVELDLRGTPEEVLARLPATAADDEDEPAPRGPGRPRLGVVAREVTLLPRHWDWLAAQPGGASATLRRLVEEARRANRERDVARLAGEAVDRFMGAMAGDLAGYEEATRAFWRREHDRFMQQTDAWPHDVREHVRQLALRAWHATDAASTPAA